MTIWRGHCAVCFTEYQHPDKHETRPKATFCPECRKTGMMAPGVVNWVEYSLKNEIVKAIQMYFLVEQEEAESMLRKINS